MYHYTEMVIAQYIAVVQQQTLDRLSPLHRSIRLVSRSYRESSIFVYLSMFHSSNCGCHSGNLCIPSRASEICFFTLAEKESTFFSTKRKQKSAFKMVWISSSLQNLYQNTFLITTSMVKGLVHKHCMYFYFVSSFVSSC